MSTQTHFTLALTTVLLLAALAAVLFVRQAVAQTATFGACYASNGVTVETTVLDGGGAFYPAPSEARVTQVDAGYVLETRTVFRRGRVYVPWVGNE